MFATTAARLREVVAKEIAASIHIHRESRQFLDEQYNFPVGPPIDEEVDDFLASNALLDPEVGEQLLDPGLLGFHAKGVRVSIAWFREFKEALQAWAHNQTWLAADEPWLKAARLVQPIDTLLWVPNTVTRPGWVDTSPSALILAAELLASGRSLCDLTWREFEELIGELLERKGWRVQVTRGSKDGGVDVIADLDDPVIGQLRALWQAKKYAASRKVQLSEVRELSAVRAEQRATKAIVVTTSRLTRGALEWIKRDTYALDYREGSDVQAWIRETVWGQGKNDA